MAVRSMREIFQTHIPVLLHETVEALVYNPAGVYVDATFGRGSHACEILKRLNPSGRLLALDKDSEAVNYGKEFFPRDRRFQLFHHSYACLEKALTEAAIHGKIDGILFDLGVSSPQLDNPARGFSFIRSGKLDMRMDTTQGIDAKTWLAKIDEASLAKVLWEYGEERFSRRIAAAIVKARQQSPIETTTQLAQIIKQVVPRPKRRPARMRGIKALETKHPATRSFQAIRIAINEELNELKAGLRQALMALKPGGRLAVISFHSLEDRLVKQFIKEPDKRQRIPRGLPIKGKTYVSPLKEMVKPIKPSLQEMTNNPRARSAILRIAEKQL